MFCRSFCVAIMGVKAILIKVEADVADGLPVFHLVGYLGSEVREASERVRSSIKNMGYGFKAKRVTVNLSPADVRKEGTAFDLSIAMALLAAFGYISPDKYDDILFLGELSLNGKVNGITGVLPAVMAARENNLKYCFVPADNVREACMVNGIGIIGISCLSEAVDIIKANDFAKYLAHSAPPVLSEKINDGDKSYDFSEICGQEQLKRAAQIAVAGRHNMLIIGAPGTGKTMLAERLADIMPDMTEEESIEAAVIKSISGEHEDIGRSYKKRPFRAPHYSISPVGLIGGGTNPVPGEITKAHNGILFLDELAEFKRSTLELLRAPLESGKVIHARRNRTVEYPCDFMLVAAMNPCPCGYYPDVSRCRCTQTQIRTYLGKLSHAFLDRIDIIIEADMVGFDKTVGNGSSCISSDMLRKKVRTASDMQIQRFKDSSVTYNSHMTTEDINKWCRVDNESRALLKNVYNEWGLSVRSYTRLLRVARTIADCEDSEEILISHVEEALFYRKAEYRLWNKTGDYIWN